MLTLKDLVDAYEGIRILLRSVLYLIEWNVKERDRQHGRKLSI